MAAQTVNATTAAEARLVPPLVRRLGLGDHTGTATIPAAGAILYCDLAGFSRRGADAIARSARGAETLRADINATFETVGRAIADHGGAILYYAGDAVAAFWQDEEAAVSSVTAARDAGLAVQRAVSTADPDQVMRAGVTHGDLWLLDLDVASGGRVPVFCGPALKALAELDLLDEGVGLCPAAASLIGAAATTAAPVTPCPAGADALEPGIWLRPHHRAGLAQGADWLAEFRQAWVLFARLTGDGAVTEHEARRTGVRVRAAIDAVEAEGGTLLQVCEDDKGLVAVAAWGLASSAWENGAERAVVAARAVAEAGARVAVAGGKVFSGLVGGDAYQQYAVVGDAINRAAAMCMAAPEQVTLDTATAEAAAQRFETRVVATLALKGQPGDAPMHGIVAERLRGIAHAGALVGRAAERQRLTAFATRIARRARGDMALVAEAGLGKSRLADGLAGEMTASDRPLLEIKGDGLRRAIGYTPLAPLVQRLLGLDAGAGADACRAALAPVVAEPSLLALLNPVLPADLPETEASRALSGPGRAERTRELIADLLAALVPDRALLIVEDAHWLDSATWQLLDSVTRRAALSLLLITRPLSPEDLPSEAQRFLDETRVETLHLAPLPQDEAGLLAAQALGAREAAAPLAALLHREAAGHPLFTAALALALAERGVIRIEAGYAHLRLGEQGLAALAIPSDAAGAVAERIAALKPEQQLTVKTAAVLGRSFDEATLAEVHPSSGAKAVGADLRAVEATGLVQRAAEGGWRFHHAIVADAAYDSLTSDQAQRLHARAARLIAARAGDAPDQADIVLMAHHAERAGDREAALRHLTVAAENARAAYANLEVVEFLTRAIALTGAQADALTLGEWRYHIAHALRALGQYQRAEDFLKLCITGLDRPPPETGGQALRRLLGGYAGYRLTAPRPPRPQAERAPVILAADATMMLSEIHYELNKIPFALAEILRGATLARRAGGDSATLAKLSIGMALISTSLPWALDGDALQSQALKIADRLDDPATEAWVYMVSGNYETGKAGWARGAAQFRHAMAVAEAAGERKTWETSTSTLGNLKRLEGWFAEAKGWSDVTLAHSRDRGIMQGVIWSHNGRTRDLLCLSEWDEMREDVATLARLLDDPANASDANDNNKLVFHYARAALAMADGDMDGGLSALDDALAIVARTARPQVYMTQNAAFYSDLIWALWHDGRRDDAMLERQAKVAKSARRIGWQYRAGVPMAHLAAGDGAWLRGRPEAARKAWRTAEAAAVARGMGFNAAHAADRLTRTGLEDRAAARDGYLSDIGIALPRLWRLAA